MLTNKGIGGNEVPLDASEAIFEIPQNRTLLAQKLTADDPVKPELVEGLNTIDKVFEHFKPEIKVDFEDAEGSVKMENLKFKNLSRFLRKSNQILHRKKMLKLRKLFYRYRFETTRTQRSRATSSLGLNQRYFSDLPNLSNTNQFFH